MVHTLRRLTLVRHGETDWNRDGRFQGRTDVALNEVGRAQARALAERFRGADVDAVCASPLSRARDTALPIGDAVGRAPGLVPDLRERDVGSWGGLTFDEIRARWPDEWDRVLAGEDLPLGGGETKAAVQRRVVAAMESVSAAHPGEHLLVVGHGMALKTLVCHLLGLDLRHSERLATGANASVTVFDVRKGVPRLTVYADASHLGG